MTQQRAAERRQKRWHRTRKHTRKHPRDEQGTGIQKDSAEKQDSEGKPDHKKDLKDNRKFAEKQEEGHKKDSPSHKKHHKKPEHPNQAGEQNQNREDKSKGVDGTASPGPPAPAAAVQQDAAPAPSPPTSPQIDAPVPPVSAPVKADDTAAVKGATTGASKPSTAVLVGAAMGVLMLLLIVGSVAAYKWNHRKKKGKKARSSGSFGGAASIEQSPAWKSPPLQRAANTSFSSYATASQFEEKQSWSAGRGRSVPTASEAEHVSLSIPQPQSRDLLPSRDDHAIVEYPSMVETGLRQYNVTQYNVEPSASAKDGTGLRIADRSSVQGEESPGEAEDTQIERCLSYYMARHTRSSIQSSRLPLSTPHIPPQSDDQEGLSPVSPDRSFRKSFGCKTANLLERIRRSQLRLNDEALYKAGQEGFGISPIKARNSRSFQSGSQDTTLSRYDVSSSSHPSRHIPAHWRSSARLAPRNQEPDEDVVQRSSQHPAFEYADCYDSYLPGHDASFQFQQSQDEIQVGFVLPWMSDSPCKSSALSPRRSTTVEMRQRSATFGSASPWPSSAGPDTTGDNDGAGRGRQRNLSYVSAVGGAHRESAEVDDVIRFQP